MGILIDVEQRSDDWFEKRVGRATTSRFNDVIAKTRNGYASTRANYKAELVIERLTGQRAEMFSSRAMDWGTETEELARLEYALTTNNKVQETGFYIHETLMCGASPDGLVVDNNGAVIGGLEIKCPNPATHIDTLRRQSIPTKYIPQVQGQMWLAGLPWVDFISFDPRMPDQAQQFIQRVYRDDEYIKMLEDEVTTFLKEVDADVEFIRNYKAPAVMVGVSHA